MSYRGNTSKVMAAAAEIARRYRQTDATLETLMTDYACAYVTIMRAMLSQMTRDEYRALARKRLTRGGVKHRFRAGHEPWNAGMKGFCPEGSKPTQFKQGDIRGAAARKYRSIGTIVVRQGKPLSTQDRARHRQSSRWIKIKDDGRPQDRYVPLSRFLWEKEHGPIPEGMFVVHADNNTMNDSLDNLILVNRTEHMRRLYERPSVIATCRRRAAAVTKRRHAQNRQAKRWAKAQRNQTQIVWDCDGCGADFLRKPTVCPKCGSSVLVERVIEPMPDSMRELQAYPQSEAI
jgi:ribosomal protein L32